MGIQTTDIKILWAKAAGRCSMSDCRQPLIAEASAGVPSGSILIGENCHIVGDSKDGPRGKSPLSDEDRDRYPNLILLCRNHHRIIDRDPDAWPIEVLHQIKSDHELWVETQLTQCEQSRADKLYSQLVNAATDNLLLAHWDAISDHAIRGLLLAKFVEGAGRFGELIFRTVWPDDKPELESALKNLNERVDAYVKHFLSLAHLRNDDVWVEDRSWKKVLRDDYDDYAEKSTRWEQRAVNLLANIVVALNEYADAVRKNLNPDYFFLQGKFTLHDSMGVTNELQEIHYMPTNYIPNEC